MVETIPIAGFNSNVDHLPNDCPLCHRRIIPQPHFAQTRPLGPGPSLEAQIVFRCPNAECGNLFISYFVLADFNDPRQAFSFRESKPTKFLAKTFEQSIRDISPAFCEIYNEAAAAEAGGLKQICGVGYRKAVEFLVKDYLIKAKGIDGAVASKLPLAACIKTYVDEGRIKEVAQRAVWLGNDETHYERVWIDKDLNDLKQMIDLLLHWINFENLTVSSLASMPVRR
jgi:hypothetical protein